MIVRRYTQRPSEGFTLIELLIVIAIILILIAIALPNFLEAQTRAKVAAVRGGLRTIQTGFEAYYTDYGQYITSHRFSSLYRGNPAQWVGCDMRLLTTPIPYIKDELPRDPFTNKDPYTNRFDNPESFFVAYAVERLADGSIRYNAPGNGPYGTIPVKFDSWMGWSAGPDNAAQTGGYRSEQTVDESGQSGAESYYPGYGGVKYSATNGSKSIGDLYVFGPAAVRNY
jgi:prepilin-type N-terminal cleavage/methylation domain-containing protein